MANCKRTWPPGMRRLSSSGVPSATIRPWSRTAIWSASSSASSRYLRGEEDRDPARHELADAVPHRPAAARVQPGGGLVEEDHPRGADEGHGQIEPAAHPARVGRHRLVRRVGKAEPLEQLADPRPPGAAAEMVEVGHQAHVLHARQQLVQRGELSGDPDRGPHRVRIVHHVVTRHAHLTGVRGDQGGEDPDHRGLAGAVRTEEGEDRPLGDRQVDAVEHHRLVKGLAHPGGERWPVGGPRSSCPSWSVARSGRSPAATSAARRVFHSCSEPRRSAPPGSRQRRTSRGGSPAVPSGASREHLAGPRGRADPTPRTR